MSGTLQIHFAPDMPAATVEVISPELDTVGRISLRPGESKAIDVPSEATFLRVHLASGKIVTLKDPGNLNRTISMAAIRETRQTPRGSARTTALTETIRSQPERPPAFGSGTPAWRLGDFEVQLLSGGRSVAAVPDRALGEIIFQPKVSEVPFELRITSRSVLTSIRLPGTLRSLTVASDRIDTSRIVVIRVATSSPAADTISAYLSRGDLYSAAAMADWADQAENLIFDKTRDPFGAAVGAYLLLRVRRLERLNWAKNLADWFPDLADGSIIYAWECVYRGINEPQIREYMQRALQAPLPVFTEGLKLLRDGMHLLEKPQEGLRLLNSAAAVPMWTSPFTTTRRVLREDPDPVEFDIGYEST